MPRRALRERVIDLRDPEQDLARGRAQRKITPRRELAQLTPSTRSATEILVAQNARRVPELVPLRFARMLADPFSFYRGSAAVMAADLAAGKSSGIEVLCCGDAHLANFGIYAAPDRALVFDLNDFDEAAIAPAEWDLKRLVTSVVIGGRHARYPSKAIRQMAERTVRAYRTGLDTMLGMTVLDRYYLRMEPERYRNQMDAGVAAVLNRTLKRARKQTSSRVFARIMTLGPDGTPRLLENPPVLEHVDVDAETELVESLREYIGGVPVDVAVVLSHFRVTDIARRVVGVGSVGTRCYLAILTGPTDEPLILQAKEASRSVLDEFGHAPQPGILREAIATYGQGVRVMDGQRILQGSSDVFLGTMRYDGRDFYVRQFHDMKGTVELQGMPAKTFGEYVIACAVALARAHAQSANLSMLRGYVGSNDTVTNAIVEWSYAYAEKSLDDFHRLRAAAKAGDIDTADGPAR
ncbi:DUF2252 domain-containing protein [[Mycobacterium] crassicus]|uniref:DUF2252 domain-containing protein n=1 Tax=[Mycobacterium] crassicus TaxID=2872309 RepID=A0ABU5XH55_9MYCO|nr:DUF2252 domain-containing protein [Mycolicibacter sp. MYC098]MEB3021213.1 DUF2252 domain-containing protein [Mycolicibacter sp. MYC098]